MSTTSRHTPPRARVLLAGVAAWAALAAITGPARADTRHGFIAGGGVGPGFASVSPSEGERQNRPGVTTDITLGYALTDQFAMFAMSRIVWFTLEGEVTFSEVAGLGATYFLSPEPGSVYLTGGLGYAVFVQPAGDAIDNQFGVGALLGAGYEPFANWLIEVDAAWNRPGDFQTVMLMTKLNYLYY